MRNLWTALGACALLSACAAPPIETAATPPAPVAVKIIAFNDFHGNLQPPKRVIESFGADGRTVQVPAGGAAYFASAVAKLRSENPNNVVVSAGDMTSASPLLSSLFLDEPTIAAMNLVGVDFNAVGNHEFDRGARELLRLQNGGCEKNTHLVPCRVEPFAGARHRYLAANVATADGGTLFPAYGIRSFGEGAAQVRVAFIGMTLKDTPTLVIPTGVAGLDFRDEAETVNALVPKLKAEGADAIVVLIHQGGYSKEPLNSRSCAGLSGDVLPILDRLDPRVDLVVSGHTHNSYICDYAAINPAKPFLLTSAGYGGTLLTDITLTIDPVADRVVAKSAEQVILQGEGFETSKLSAPIDPGHPRFEADPRVTALIDRYAAAVKVEAERPVGKLARPALRDEDDMAEQPLGNLIADAQLAATAAPDSGGAQIALMNPGGVRADLNPRAGGTVTFGDIYAVQPFGNVLTTRSYTGAQLRAVLEQQFDPAKAGSPLLLLPSRGFTYSYDRSRPVGRRIVDMRLNGVPIDPARVYRVTASNFLMNGGDGFTTLAAGTDATTGMQDLDALELYFAQAGTLTPPAADRTRDLTPKN